MGVQRLEIFRGEVVLGACVNVPTVMVNLVDVQFWWKCSYLTFLV